MWNNCVWAKLCSAVPARDVPHLASLVGEDVIEAIQDIAAELEALHDIGTMTSATLDPVPAHKPVRVEPALARAVLDGDELALVTIRRLLASQERKMAGACDRIRQQIESAVEAKSMDPTVPGEGPPQRGRRRRNT